MTNPCGRCTASRSLCSGPVEGALFVNRHLKAFTRDVPRKVMRDALLQRYNHDEGTITNRSQQQQRDSSITNMMSLDAIIGGSSSRALYASLLEEFRITSLVKEQEKHGIPNIFKQSFTAICLRSVIELGSTSFQVPRMLDIGIFSLLNLYFGKIYTRHSRLTELSRKFYGLAIQSLRRSLSCLQESDSKLQNDQQRQKFAQNTFCLSLVLVLFELVDTPTATKTLDIHIDGALSILQRMGPEVFATSNIRTHLLPAFRGMAYASAARRRRSLFMDEPRWQHVFHSGKDENHLNTLFDVAVHLPRLLERTELLMSRSPQASHEVVANLLSDYKLLKSLFLSWHFQQLSDDTSHAGPRDLAHVEHFVRAQSEAEYTLHLSTMLIELEMGLSDVFSSCPQQSKSESMWHTSSNQQARAVEDVITSMMHSIRVLNANNDGQMVAAIPAETLKRYRDRHHFVTPLIQV